MLLLLAPLVFWRELYDSLSVPKRALIQVGALVLLSLAVWQRKVWRWPQPLGFFTVLFLLWALVSLMWATNPWLGWWTWWQWVACALVGWVVLQVELTPERLRALLWTMAGSGAIVAVIGLAQAWFGWAWVPQAIAPGSTLANRNMAAQVMVLVIPIAAVLVYLARCRREVIMATITLTLCVTFLGHTFTKGCWIAFGCSVLLAGALGWRCGWRPSFQSKEFQALLMAAGIAALAINVTNEGVRWRWAEIGAYLTGLAEEPETNVTEADRLQAKSSRSVAVRTIFWRNTLVMIREQPVLGVGLNNWRVAYPAATLQGVPDPTLAGRSPERTHNDLLQIWAELGTIGLLLALAVVGLFLREAWRGLAGVGSREERVVVIGAVAALGAIAVDSLFSFPLDREVPPLFTAVLVGVVLRSARRGRSEGRSDSAGALVLPAGSRQHRAVGFVVIVAAVLMGVWHARQWEADRLFKQQLAAVRRADWAEVVRLGNQIKQADPTRIDAYRFTGRAQEQLGQLDEAWMDLKLALQYAPDDTQLLHYSALTAQKRGHYGAAEEAWRRAAAILPKEALFPHHLGLLYLARQDAAGALRELLRAKELNPQDATVYFNLGLAYEQMGQKAEAIASYRKAVELRPGWEEARRKLEETLKE
jgi:O-antigen ligase/Flp pilus assembly protein TadD